MTVFVVATSYERFRRYCIEKEFSHPLPTERPTTQAVYAGANIMLRGITANPGDEVHVLEGAVDEPGCQTAIAELMAIEAVSATPFQWLYHVYYDLPPALTPVAIEGWLDG